MVSPMSSGPTMPNLLARRLLKTTSTKKLRPLKTHNLSWAPNRSSATQNETGTESGTTPSKVNYLAYQHPSVYLITGLSEQSAKTMYNQLRKTEVFTFSGVRLELGKVAVLGKRREWMLTLRLPLLNSGMATKVSGTLSVMNFEEISRCPTSCDGWTGIQSLWKSKAPLQFSPQQSSGSPPIYTPELGFQL